MKVIVTGQKEMENKLCCVICGKDITRSMKIYPHGHVGGSYCYDCAEAEKARLKRLKPPDKRRIKAMHKRGLKPSEIAEIMEITVKEVYEVITK